MWGDSSVSYRAMSFRAKGANSRWLQQRVWWQQLLLTVNRLRSNSIFVLPLFLESNLNLWINYHPFSSRHSSASVPGLVGRAMPHDRDSPHHTPYKDAHHIHGSISQGNPHFSSTGRLFMVTKQSSRKKKSGQAFFFGDTPPQCSPCCRSTFLSHLAQRK